MGNCCVRCRGGTFHPDKSYMAASWQDYVEWSRRLGYHVTWDRNNRVLTIVLDNGDQVEFTTREAIFEFLVENGARHESE